MSNAKYWPTSLNKFHAVKTTVDGITFDSRKEADYYCYLKTLKRTGEVTGFERQVPYELQPQYIRKGKTVRAIKYVADFVVTYSDGHVEVVDVKGVRTKEYSLKKKLLEYKYPDIDFREV